MNARIFTEAFPAPRDPVTKPAPKRSASPFDDALQQHAPEHPPRDTGDVAQPHAATKKPTPEDAHVKTTRTADEDSARTARLLALMNVIPLTALVAPSIGFQPEPAVALTEADLPGLTQPEPTSVTKPEPEIAAAPNSPDDEPTRPGAPVEDDEPTVQLPAANERAQPEVAAPDDAHIAQLIAAVQEPKPRVEARAQEQKGVPVVATLANVAEPTVAVDSVAAPREVEWHGLAERIADVVGTQTAGSIEGHRARLVMGEGDERLVLTVSTRAHKVAIEVDTSSRAGSMLADALRSGSDELRHALDRHGLELEQGETRRQQPDAEAPQKEVRRPTPAAAAGAPPRAAGVVLA